MDELAKEFRSDKKRIFPVLPFYHYNSDYSDRCNLAVGWNFLADLCDFAGIYV